MIGLHIFFFKQKTAYEMRISDLEFRRVLFRSKKAAISTQLAALDGDIRELDLRQNELEQIQRDVESYTNNYKIYLGKVEEARIEEQMDIRKMVNVSVIEPATAPLRPATPQKENGRASCRERVCQYV